jgi:L-alanine-DL-glutamate epimerase-like enolase superfamily enzyme
MKFGWEVIELRLKDRFRISRGEIDSKKVVITEIEQGRGEASPSSYYGESWETVVKCLGKLKENIPEDPSQIEKLLRHFGDKSEFNQAARAAIDIALHDLLGKRMEMPVRRLLGLSGQISIPISHTIGMDSIEKMQEKTLQAEGFEILKVKMGIEGDLDMLKAVREVTDKKIRVDANAGWETEEAIQKINQLEDLGVELIEQPLKPENKDGFAQIRKNTFLPIIVDEPVCTSGDIPPWVGLCDGINVKLMKSGGIKEALSMIKLAKSLGLKVMLGCMIESSLGVAAAAQLASEADYLDLDSHLLIENDPFVGIGLGEGKLMLNDKPGLGVMPRTKQEQGIS